MPSCPYSLADAGQLEQRFDMYRHLREEAPVYVDPQTGYYVVTRYGDVHAIARDFSRFSNKTEMLIGRGNALYPEITQMFAERGVKRVATLSSNDPPSYKSYRSIVDAAFRPDRVIKMADYMEGIVNQLIDGFENAGRVEFISAFAVRLPMIVIAEQMGIDTGHMDDFKRWSDAVIDTANILTSHEKMIANADTMIEAQTFLVRQFEIARAAPRDDIISDIATAELEGRKLSMEEMVSIALTLLVAGNETTTNALGSAMLRMIETGAEAGLRDGSITTAAFTEEVLRMDAPIQLLYRRALTDVTVGDTVIPEGAMVQIVWAAANRDAAKFPGGEDFRTDRGLPGFQHMTFGSGIHFCVGNTLARAEISATLRLITQRLRNVRIAAEPDARVDIVHPLAFGPSRLVLAFEKNTG